MPGLYARQSEAAARLGLVGFLLAFFATVFVEGDFYANTFVTPLVAQDNPALLINSPYLASYKSGSRSISCCLLWAGCCSRRAPYEPAYNPAVPLGFCCSARSWRWFRSPWLTSPSKLPWFGWASYS
jgi:hypothetical protein